MDQRPAALRRGGGLVLLVLVLIGLGLIANDAAVALEIRFVLVVAAALAVVLAIRHHRPDRPRPWWLLALGMGLSATGDLAVLIVDARGQLDGNLPLDAWLTAIAGALFLAAILDVVRAVGGSGRIGALDAVVATTAAGTVLWQLLVVPAATPGWSGSGTELAGALQVAALLGVLALLVQVIALLPAERRTAARWMAFAIVAGLGAFLVGALRDATGAEAYGGLRAVTGAVANLSAAAAACHPSMRWLTVRREVPVDGVGPGRTTLMVAALAAPPSVLLVAALTGRPLSLISLALTWLVLSVALVARGRLLERGREAARVQLARSERRLISLVANTGDTVLLVAVPPTGPPAIRFASPSAERLLGWPPEGLRARAVELVVEEEDRETLRLLVAEDGPLPRTADVRARHRDGHHRWVEAVVSEAPQEEVASVVLTLRDVDGRKRAELELAEAASRDPLTGLLNRRAFEAAVVEALAPISGAEPAPARRRAADVALLLVDLDRFKQVNDRAGHAAGDAVLARVADTLAGLVRDTDVIARVGGDEFAVLCTRLGPRDQVAPLARRIADLAVTSDVPDAPTVGASVGLAVARDGDTVASLLARADDALYQAKRGGRGRLQVAGEEEPPTEAVSGTG